MPKVRLKQLAQDGATSGQAVVWNNVTGLWEPGTAGSGDVTAAASLADNRLIRGDTAAKGVQQSGISISDADAMTDVLSIAGPGACLVTGTAAVALGDGTTQTGTVVFTASGIGASAFGTSAASNASGASTLLSSSHGTIAMGYSLCTSTGSSTVTASGQGAFVQGYASASLASSSILAVGAGSHAGGRSSGDGTIETTSLAAGAFCRGFVETGGLLRASGEGSFVSGACVLSPSSITASGDGAVAIGQSTDAAGGTATMLASGIGFFAGGRCLGVAGTATISATNSGSFAFGYTGANGTISATAANAVQFGVGTNATADSLQVGAGVKILGPLTTSPTTADGMIWTGADGKMRCHTNGTTRLLGVGAT